MRIKYTLLFVLFLNVTIAAKTVNLTDYGAIANDGNDDAPALQLAVNDLKANDGGTVIFPGGTIDLRSKTSLITGSIFIGYKLKGDKGSIVRVNTGIGTGTFDIGNANQIEFDGLTFVGGSPEIDTEYLLVSGYTSQTIIRNCQFFGLYARVAIFLLENTDALIENSQFDGSGGGYATIYATKFQGLTVRNSTFIDYANFRDLFTKNLPVQTWIRAETTEAKTARVLRLEDVRMDEAAFYGLHVIGVNHVNVSGLAINVYSHDPGTGILLDNVKYAEIKQSIFGLRPNPRAAIRAINNTTAVVTALTLADGVTYMERDSSSNIITNYCPGCEVRTLAASPTPTPTPTPAVMPAPSPTPIPPPTPAGSFNAVNDFSATNNPTGAWSYGYKATSSSAFIRYTDHGQPWSGISTWSPYAGGGCYYYDDGG